jgi:hypothetical protein
VLVSHAAEDASLRKKLRMLLAGTAGAGKMAAEVAKRIQTIGRSRAMVDWERRKPLVQELNHLRVTVTSTLAAQDAMVAVGLLWDFIGIADSVMNLLGEPGPVEDTFDAAKADLGRLLAAQPDTDRIELGRWVLAMCERDGFGGSDAIISHLSAALASEGRSFLRRATEAAFRDLGDAEGKNDWAAMAERRRLAFRLARLADLEQDVDAFIEAVRTGGIEESHRIGIAGRLLAAARPEAALQWLDAPRRAAQAARPRRGGGGRNRDRSARGGVGRTWPEGRGPALPMGVF